MVESALSAFSAEEQKTMALKSSSTVQYRDALAQDVDLEYIVLPSRVKENIILNSPKNITSYVVTVYTENLTPRLLENRRIQFSNSQGEVIFTMASPYMYDSAGELSEDVAVEMMATGRDCYQIRMTPDAQWLSDKSRVYPVVIDPQVTTDSARTNIIDNYVLEGSGVQNNNLDRLYIGNKSGHAARAYIKFNTMPAIPSGATISSATMTLHLTSGTSTAYTANAYKVTGGDWASDTITWANKPAASTLLQSNISHNNLTKYSFSCTSAVQSWYNGSTTGQNANYGVMLCYSNASIADYNAVYSADYSTESKRPSITFTYEASTTVIDVDEGMSKALTPPNVSGTITWSCNDTTIATVNSYGTVAGVKAGQTLV
ncbi:MAG: DNRLRE domain-containing protein, partial [Oscillospiraceae bacterium]|nr:DNRLRE domain-containing protein [Oscillospiraceae bacterium]